MLLDRVAHIGICDKKNKRKPFLSLIDLFPILKREAEQNHEMTPRFFTGSIPIDLGFVRNIQFSPRTESLRSHRKTLLAFWNNGHPDTLDTEYLSDNVGRTAHTTWAKLTYAPAWALLNKLGRGKGCLSERGQKFMRNEIGLPEIIEQDPVSKQWTKANESKMIKFQDLINK